MPYFLARGSIPAHWRSRERTKMHASNIWGTKNARTRRLVVLTVVAALILTIFPFMGGTTPARAAACTDNARTYHGVTMDNKYVELRGSSNCNGTAWIRWNYSKTTVEGAGTVKFQVANACGTVTNGESNSISSVGGTANHITAYKSGIVRARMIYTRSIGSPPSFTSPWYNVGGKTTTC